MDRLVDQRAAPVLSAHAPGGKVRHREARVVERARDRADGPDRAGAQELAGRPGHPVGAEVEADDSLEAGDARWRSISASASSSERASGFSTNTCLPASSAALPPPREHRSARRPPPPPRPGPPPARAHRVAARDPEVVADARGAVSSRSHTASTLSPDRPHERRQVPVLGGEAASHESDAYGPHCGQSRMDPGNPCRCIVERSRARHATVLEDPAGGRNCSGSCLGRPAIGPAGVSPTCSAPSCWPTSGALRPRPAASREVAHRALRAGGGLPVLVALVLDRPDEAPGSASRVRSCLPAPDDRRRERPQRGERAEDHHSEHGVSGLLIPLSRRSPRPWSSSRAWYWWAS